MTFTLKTDNSTAVCTEAGGELISFVCGGTEYIWNGDAKYWSEHAPHLFPAVCSSKDASVIYDGKSYPMKKHGIVRGEHFETVELSLDSVTFENRWNESTLKSYPYRYTFRVRHSINDSGFSTEYTVYGEDDMCFCIGGHPGFVCPFPDGGAFEEYDLHFQNARGAVMSLTENGYMNDNLPKLRRIKNNILPLKYSDFERDAMIVEKLPAKRVELVSRLNGHGFRFTFEGFDALGIWTPDGKNAPFLCLEPWCGLPANVNESGRAEDKKYSIHLTAGEKFRVGYQMSVI